MAGLKGAWRVWIPALLLAAAGLIWLAWPTWPKRTAIAPSALATYYAPRRDGPVQPLPQSIDLNADQVALGRILFEDKRLSADDTVSCASCHTLRKYGVDGLAVSSGIHGQKGELNAPTVYNSAFNFRQFWDGRAATLEQQVDGPVGNPIEMGSNWRQVLAKLDVDGDLQMLAIKAYGHRLDAGVVRSAIATFERSLITPNSPFDRFLAGNRKAMSTEAVAGWRRFRELGCIACHQGVNLGGNMYATMGTMGDYFKGRPILTSDLGLYNRTGQAEDKFKFKVPTLRNVAETAPYFHDGRVGKLDDAVTDMAQLQLGLKLDDGDKAALVAFLNSLTGSLPGAAE